MCSRRAVLQWHWEGTTSFQSCHLPLSAHITAASDTQHRSQFYGMCLTTTSEASGKRGWSRLKFSAYTETMHPIQCPSNTPSKTRASQGARGPGSESSFSLVLVEWPRMSHLTLCSAISSWDIWDSAHPIDLTE